MTLKIYNTLKRKKEILEPIKEGKVGIYVCGITAYDSCHLGHARAAICFDVITRYLRYRGFDVSYVRNYTDIDDKIINRANKENKTCKEISELYIAEYKRDMLQLGNIAPDIEPKATEHIEDMISTIQKLIDNGLAYARDGNVFFSVRKFPGYGKLSGKNIDDLESGARVDVNETKDDPLDFALWKASKPGEPKWTSPWGEGRPGWHIECSAMSSKYLGQPFDIHGGGRDLVFPHHENEIAQAEGAEKRSFVKYWLHNGFININSEKMSKSLGNFMTINDAIKAYGAEAIRFFIISNHYRSPIDYTEKAMAESSSALDRYYEAVRRLPCPAKHVEKATPTTAAEKEIQEVLDRSEAQLIEFMDDDFNTAGGIGVLFDAVRAINRYLDTNPDTKHDFYQCVLTKWKGLRDNWKKIFGMFGSDPNKYFEDKKTLSISKSTLDESAIDQLIADRKEARKTKNFGRADEIRKQLDQMGIIIKDLPDGTTEWRVK